MPRIEVIGPNDAEGPLKDVYQSIIKSRGKIAEVHEIQSLNTESIVNHMDLYMTVMFGQSPLKRYQREMMAVVVSACNDCEYCQRHHAEALQFFWKDEAKVSALKTDYRSAGIDHADEALCSYAEKVTRDPGRSGREDLTSDLKKHGFSDRAILDATLVVAYFNFVNRIVLALGVEIENDPGGYRYE